ncbi:MAG: Aminopeptidase N [Chlorobi bacterium OLB5]|nr:MAG: Aminopeptidase N [Chlorobi bacterium OLB5]
MKIIKTIIILTVFQCCVIFTQSLYIPLEFQAAYENGTRSLDGKPGAEYWQNRSDYKINASIDPVTGLLNGSAVITYYNSSPDTLDKIILRLYPNIYKKDAMRDFPYRSVSDSEGIMLQSISVGKRSFNISSDTSLEYTGTNLLIKNISINPGKQTVINVTWEFRIPKDNGIRMGQYDSSTIFIAYWYPQVAVYDDIDEWDLTEYTGQAEFYNDFNNYDVKITLPINFGVWAAGELQNPQDVLAQNILSKYSQALVSTEVVHIISDADIRENLPLFNSSGETNTWHFIAKNITDFTFGAASGFLWDGRLADGGGKKIFVNAVYKPAAITFYEVCDITSRTVEMLSKELPGIPFPFPKITVFNGRGGMESPMMVNMGAGEQRIWTVHTTVHEVVHSYFPFYTGCNERKYAWMDEGLTQMISEYIQYELDKTIDFRARNVKRYLDYAGQFDEFPMMYPSYMIKGEMYGNHAYFRPANAFNMMKDFMGDAVFKKALQEFIKRWNGKHPTPYDFFFTIEDVTGDELNWFFEPWFFKQGFPDLAIDSAFVKDDLLKIEISKEGELPVPAALTVKFKDGSTKRIYRTVSAWKNEEDESIWVDIEAESKPSVIELGNQYIPDIDSTNNYWHFK